MKFKETTKLDSSTTYHYPSCLTDKVAQQYLADIHPLLDIKAWNQQYNVDNAPGHENAKESLPIVRNKIVIFPQKKHIETQNSDLLCTLKQFSATLDANTPFTKFHQYLENNEQNLSVEICFPKTHSSNPSEIQIVLDATKPMSMLLDLHINQNTIFFLRFTGNNKSVPLNLFQRIYIAQDISTCLFETFEGKGTVFQNSTILISEKAKFKHQVLLSGQGKWVSQKNIFLGSCSTSSSYHIGFATKNDSFHHNVTDTHQASNSESFQYFRHIATDHAKSGIESRVCVAKKADDISSKQMLKQTALSANAQLHSRPTLNINKDKVNCTHGSVIGSLSEMEKTYLRSRGLNELSIHTLLLQGLTATLFQDLDDKDTSIFFNNQICEKLYDCV